MKTANLKTLVFSGLLAACNSAAFAMKKRNHRCRSAPAGTPVEFERTSIRFWKPTALCHNAATAENQLILENAAAILKGGTAGPSIVPGKPEESLFIKVAARTAEPVMPPWPNDVQAKKLTPKELGILSNGWLKVPSVGPLQSPRHELAAHQ